jgi:UDP-GlcNAc:undecaprenyl-phosphate GlcNAc-1-phosphate transferase
VTVLLAIAIVTATVTALAVGALVRRLAPVYGAVVPPRADRWHSVPTPTMGGIAIAAATLAGFGVAALAASDGLGTYAEWLSVLGAALAMFAVGVLDDRLHLSPVAKLVASLVVGAFFVFALVAAEPGGALPTGYTLVGIIWFAGLCHAFNLLDNMDGLAAGVALIAALFLAWLLGPTLGSGVTVLLIALVGALLGFLYWNRPRARLFMGDSGSLFIGALLAGASLVPVFHPLVAFIDPGILIILILVVPLFDTSFVLVLRRLAGRSATRGGTDHVSHRLASLGLSERSAVRTLYLLGLIGGLTAWVLVKWYSAVEPIFVVALFGVLVTLFGIYLARVEAYNAEDFQALQKSSFAPFLKDLAFKFHVGEVLLDMILITACYYAAFRLRFDGAELEEFLRVRPSSFENSLPIVLGVKIAALYSSGLYRRSWETFGFRDLAAVARGVGMGSLLTVAVLYYLFRVEGSSRSVLVLDGLLLALAISATRASFRTMSSIALARNRRHRRVLVYGAGGYGRLIVREMRANPAWKMNPVGFIDDDPMKAHRWIVGVPVRGSIDQLEQTLTRVSVDEVLLSSPKINGKVEHRIREICTRLDRPVRRLEMKIS